MIPSLATMRLFIFSRLYAPGTVARAELAMWLRREAELRELHAAIDALHHQARTLVARGGDA